MKTYLKPQTKAAGIEEHQAIPMIALCCGVFSRFTGNTNTSFDLDLQQIPSFFTLQHIALSESLKMRYLNCSRFFYIMFRLTYIPTYGVHNHGSTGWFQSNENFVSWSASWSTLGDSARSSCQIFCKTRDSETTVLVGLLSLLLEEITILWGESPFYGGKSTL